MVYDPKGFTRPVHQKLLKEINDMSISIKVWHMHTPKKTDEPDKWDKIKQHHKEPTGQEIEDLLMRAYYAIDEIREDPRKY